MGAGNSSPKAPPWSDGIPTSKTLVTCKSTSGALIGVRPDMVCEFISLSNICGHAQKPTNLSRPRFYRRTTTRCYLCLRTLTSFSAVTLLCLLCFEFAQFTSLLFAGIFDGHCGDEASQHINSKCKKTPILRNLPFHSIFWCGLRFAGSLKCLIR